MLQSLYIRDYALIEELLVNFSDGLNIITGETGAGKSILIGGLKLILGERAQTDALRTGAKKAIVEGVFSVADHAEVKRLLAEDGFDASDELILRREVRENQSRAFVNDSPASLQQMRRIASELVDLHGQHDHQSLLRPATHLSLVDALGDYDGLLGAYRLLYGKATALDRERSSLNSREKEMIERRELLSYQIQEIDRVAPEPGEVESLDVERRVLENAETLSSSTAMIYERLYESDQSVLASVVQARNELHDLAAIDPAFEELAHELETARISIDEASKSIHDYHLNIEFDPERMEWIRQRLGALDTLCRRFGGSLGSVLSHRMEIGKEYDRAAEFESERARIEDKFSAACLELSQLALDLSENRVQTAAVIDVQVREQLEVLGMPDACFEIRITRSEQDSGWIELPATQSLESDRRFEAGPEGIDHVAFYLSANRGEKMRPLDRVASGGEISRIMLALKSVLARRDGVPVLVFDEIDAGISGGIAHRVSESLQHLALDHQILVITHLPQVAAKADAHFKVGKRVENSRTKTFIVLLSDEERQTEIATLLSGDTITDAALESARELIQA